MDGNGQAEAQKRALALGCIADDHTGATDLANTLARAGLSVVQTIGVPDPDLAIPAAEALVVALKIRSVPAQEAVSRARAAREMLVAAGAGHVLYKICSTFDSTDAGNIGPVTDALRADAGAAIVPVCPAFPGTGRTVYQGHLFVGDRLLSESPLKDHPLNPMRDADLVRVLSRQSAAPVGLVAHADVRAGAEAIGKRLAALAGEGRGAAIVDAVCDDDLIPLGQAALAHPVSTGASGLGHGLARALIASGRASESVSSALPPVGGPAVILAGSSSAATRAQLAAAQAFMPVMRIDAAAAIADPERALADALAFAREKLPSGPLAIATSAEPEVVAAVQARFGAGFAGAALEGLLARIAEHLVAYGLRRLVVAGGETSGAVVEALQIKALRIGAEIAPGVPATLALGAPAGALALALKSGNFGGEDFFARALEALP
ncbi:3-oxo-tetronate kinase [Salinarimonas ramus]|uniref:3-oxo-tetronate kinase n=1 Tax=Salinarimonas ramus TaxID=690164 RepID=A0A917V370_9HYPH|nr:3-oxo-tetronate kinase [Salinarimonas ramus]GGK29710.1 HPr kinase [Salinarimonas ramus]